jgi:hypothetical protein
MSEKQRTMPANSNPKRWWETWWGQSILLIVTGVIAGVVTWLVTSHYERTLSTATQQSQPQLQPAPQAPTSTPAATPPSQAAPAKKSPSQTTQHVTARTSADKSPAVGSIQQGPGSALSIGQQGGITAGTVTISNPERHLTPQQIAALAQVSIPSSAKLGVLTSEDSDSQIFANEIYVAIDPKHESRWYQVGYGRVPPLPRGVYIGARDKDQRKALSSTLESIKNILNTAETPVSWLEDESLAPGNFEIIVGPR